MEGLTQPSLTKASSLGRDCLASSAPAPVSKVVAIRQISSPTPSSSGGGALRIPCRSNARSFRTSAVHQRRRFNKSTSVVCLSNSDGTRREERRDGPAFSFSAVVVPMLAAAVIGGVQPDVQALDGDQFTAPDGDTETVEDMDAQSPSSPVRGLFQRIKGRGSARKKNSPTPPTDEQLENSSITSSSPFLKSESATKPPPAPPAPPLREIPPPAPPAPSPPPVAVKPSPAEDFLKKEPKAIEVPAPAPAPVSRVSKTHGFLPLFMSQFLLLVASLGGGYVLITTPDSKWSELQQTVDGYVSKATPVIEDSWTKAKPVAAQVGEQAQRFGVAAKPYVTKAWETAVPIAGKAVEASKPILKAAQSKIVEFLNKEKSNP